MTFKFKITEEEFAKVPNGKMFAYGIAGNEPNGLYMTDAQIDRPLAWVAVKGWANDWAVYCAWADEKTIPEVVNNGDKVSSKENIKNILDVDESVLARYRY